MCVCEFVSVCGAEAEFCLVEGSESTAILGTRLVTAVPHFLVSLSLSLGRWVAGSDGMRHSLWLIRFSGVE